MHSFDKTLRTLYIPILNTSNKYENIGKGSLLGTFEPIDEEVSEVQVTSWTDLEGKSEKRTSSLGERKVTGKPGGSIVTRKKNKWSYFQVIQQTAIWKWTS